jgi:hypothetical protein
VPLGEYEEDKLVNLGTNRFTIRPQLGLEHWQGNWVFEVTGSIWFFTDNDDFLKAQNVRRTRCMPFRGTLFTTLSRVFGCPQVLVSAPAPELPLMVLRALTNRTIPASL